MADVKWIKITTDIFDDEKILLLESMPSADSIIVVWFKLLALAGKQNNNGVFLMSNRIAYTDEMLATIFRRDVNTVRLALKAFEQFGMVEIVEGVITIPNWNKHQTLDAYEKKKERDRLYQAQRRAAQRALVGKSSEPSLDASLDKSSDVAISDKEEERDIDIDKERGAKRKRFSPPSLEDVRAYCLERNNSVDPQRFIDYYESKGWVVGKSKMKDWKAAVRTWENNGYSTPKKTEAANAYLEANKDNGWGSWDWND